jgi:hypothetical protein
MGTVRTLTDPLVSGPRSNGIYTINLDLKSESPFSNPLSEQAYVADAALENKFTTWHKRLRHLNVREMRNLQLEHPEIFKWTEDEINSHKSMICRGCALGKLSAKPLRSTGGASRPVTRRGELVFIDLYFSNIPSIGGNTCALIIVDAFTKIPFTYFGKDKSSCAQMIKVWIEDMKRLKVDIESFSIIKSDGGVQRICFI